MAQGWVKHDQTHALGRELPAAAMALKGSGDWVRAPFCLHWGAVRPASPRGWGHHAGHQVQLRGLSLEPMAGSAMHLAALHTTACQHPCGDPFLHPRVLAPRTSSLSCWWRQHWIPALDQKRHLSHFLLAVPSGNTSPQSPNRASLPLPVSHGETSSREPWPGAARGLCRFHV